MKRLIVFLVLVASLLTFIAPIQAQDAPQIALVTPYIEQPGTKLMVDAFQAEAETKGWEVTLYTTESDNIIRLVGYMEDIAREGADAVVINVDPAEVQPGLEFLAEAEIPVFGMDAGTSDLLVTNVTSNGYVMASETATYVVDRLNGVGRVVMFIFEPYPPVQKRGAIAETIFANTPDIEIVEEITPSFENGPVEGAREAMLGVLESNPEPGSISAVWAAWDDPALGALQAIQEAGREDEGIIIVGIDATPPARDAIAAGSNFAATIAQDFPGIAAKVAELVEQHLNGEEITRPVYYVDAQLITAETLAE